MLAYVINLDRAHARWVHIAAAFQDTGFDLVRVPAVDGKTLSPTSAEFNPATYRRRHGRPINILEVACYLSHMKALSAFLAGTQDPHALILEDDVIPGPELGAVTQAALRIADAWDILRLSGLAPGNPLHVTGLSPDHALCVNIGRLKGTGAYLVNRAAARRLVDNLLPMGLPYDHALDREWFLGLRAFCARPFPISQVDSPFKSSIQGGSTRKLGRLHRYTSTYPYQAFNEVTRYLFRLGSFASAIVNPAIRSAAPGQSLPPINLPVPIDPPASPS